MGLGASEILGSRSRDQNVVPYLSLKNDKEKRATDYLCLLSLYVIEQKREERRKLPANMQEVTMYLRYPRLRS